MLQASLLHAIGPRLSLLADRGLSGALRSAAGDLATAPGSDECLVCLLVGPNLHAFCDFVGIDEQEFREYKERWWHEQAPNWGGVNMQLPY